MQNHPKLASDLKSCPFNARHLFPKHELTHHTETCEDRISVDAEDGEIITWLSLYSSNSEVMCYTVFQNFITLFTGGNHINGHYKWQVPVSTWVNPNTTEDWDKGMKHVHSI